MLNDKNHSLETKHQIFDKEIVISIIIANYNARDLLRQCLDSIFANSCNYLFDVYVIDDCSCDGSYEMTKEEFPQVHVYKNDKNLHYGASNNRMFLESSGKYIYLLNSDTIMLPGALDKMAEFLDNHPNAGCVGSKLLNEDGSTQASVKSLPNIMSGLFGSRSFIYKVFPNNRFSRREILHLCKDMKKPFKAGYVSSASVMIRRCVVEQVGHLDPRLSYHVDADYCARIWDADWDVYYLPDSVIIHLDHKGGTLLNPMRRFKSTVEFHLGTWIYYQKHQMKHFWHPMTFVVLAGLIVRFIFSLSLQQSKEMVTLISSTKGKA